MNTEEGNVYMVEGTDITAEAQEAGVTWIGSEIVVRETVCDYADDFSVKIQKESINKKEVL